MKLSELTPTNYRNLPEIKYEDLQLLWFDDYWDGPLNGLLIYQNRKYWYKVFDEFDDGDVNFYRRFAVIELTPEQLEEEEYWHNLFREKVGYPSDKDEKANSGKRQNGPSINEVTTQEFYAAYKKRKPQDFSNNIVIRWFEH